MKTITRYACEVCGTEYKTEAKARQCEDQKQPEAIAEAGDIVTAGAGFGWFDGDVRWITNPEVQNKPRNPRHGNCFSACCTMAFYYVVTAIDIEPENVHRRRYHIATKAMTGEQGHHDGYTFDDGHKSLKRVENAPEFVVNDSKDLIGRKAKYLL